MIKILFIFIFFAGCSYRPVERDCCKEKYLWLSKQNISEKEKDREMKRHYMEKHWDWYKRNKLLRNQ